MPFSESKTTPNIYEQVSIDEMGKISDKSKTNQNNSNQKTNKIKSKNGLKNFFELFWWVVNVGLLVALFLIIFVFQQVNVVGPSMQTNFFEGDRLVVNTMDKNIVRGQVVAAYANRDVAKNANYFTRISATFYLKRVVGLPGETIEILGDKVIIYNYQNPNGFILNEEYLSANVLATEKRVGAYRKKVIIPSGEYFLMGDNRPDSKDSRDVGTFPEYSIFGKVVYRYAPIEKINSVSLPSYTTTGITNEVQQKINILTKATAQNQ